MRNNLRVGSTVTCDDVASPNYLLAGKVVACHAPGATSKSGTAGFKFVAWRIGRRIETRGEFVRGLRRIDASEFARLINAQACGLRPDTRGTARREIAGLLTRC